MKYIFFLGLYVLIPALAFASESHEPRWGDFGWRILNLIIFCWILWFFIGKIWKQFFRNRKQTIQDTLSDLETRRKEAKEKLAEIEKRIANLEAERQAILDESRKQAERIKNGIVADANQQAQHILDQAKRSAENEGKAMLDQVRNTVASEIVEAAAKALSGKLTNQDHDKLIDNALDKVTLQ